jgi:L-serine deaminase
MAQRWQTAALLGRLAKLGCRSSHGQACVAGAQHGGGIKVGGRHLRPQTASPIAGPRHSIGFRGLSTTARSSSDGNGEQDGESDVLQEREEHAIISAFDLFSVGIGPSSSHTVGPMRAGNIFVTDLIEAGILHKVNRIRISIYGSLALTGEGHMTPSALLLGLEGANVESVDTAYVPTRFAEIKESKKLRLGGGGSTNPREIDFDYGRDFVWEWSRKLPMHSNGMRFRVFDENGDMLATNDLFSVGGGFVINGNMSTASSQTLSDTQSLQQEAGAENQSAQAVEPTGTERHPADLSENLFYKEIKRSNAAEERRAGSDYDFRSRETSSEQALQPFVPEAGSKSLEIGAPGPISSEPRHAPHLFRSAKDLLALCKRHNLTIAQLMFENEKGLGLQEHEIFDQLFHLWDVMDNCIREGVQAPSHAALPGSLKLRRRAPALYQQLTRGLYPEHTQVQPTTASPQIQGSSSSAGQDALAIAGKTEASSRPPALRRAAAMRQRRPPHRLHGSPHHPISIVPVRSAALPAMDYLTVYAIAVNETNAAGGRVVTAPTNGAAGIIPAVLKYIVEFVSDDPERDIPIFLLTAAAIASLFKRGATISAAEGGCMAEVGVACSMAAGAYAACMGAGPETIEQAAEIGIEHNLGLTCDPVAGLVQAPCIERNALGAIKAVSSANLALNSVTGLQKVTLDDAIRAMRLTAKGMKDEFKETSLSGLATSVPLNIPVSVPDC